MRTLFTAFPFPFPLIYTICSAASLSLFLLAVVICSAPMALALTPLSQPKVPKMFDSLLAQPHNQNNNNNNNNNDDADKDYEHGDNAIVGGAPMGYGDQLELLAHSSRMARTCRHQCSISDPNAAQCWNDTLAFYEQMLYGMLRRVILVETNRIMWMMGQNERQHRLGVNYAKLTTESLHRFMQLPLRQIVADENDWDEAPVVFERVSPAIMRSVRLLTNKLQHFYSNGHGLLNEPPPFLRFDCPRPCERGYVAWKWLFVASLSFFLLQLCLICAFIFLLDRREQKVWRTESTEFGENATAVVLVKKGQKQRKGSAVFASK